MNYKVDSGKLFEGLDEIVAKVVREGSVHVLKLKATEQPNLYEIVGNTAVKADEPLLETQVLEGMTVRLKLEEAHQVIERYKAELKKERERTAMYKQKYEDVLYEKDSMTEEYEAEVRSKDDEIHAKDEEIKKLRTQLEYAEKHPQSVTNVYGNQHNHLEDNRSQVVVQEMVVKDNGTGVQTSETKEEDNGVNTTKDIKICRFIAQDRIKNNTTYGRTEEERIDSYNRIIYRQSLKKFSSFVKFLKEENMKGNLKFDTQDLEEIYNHLLECYETLHGNLRSFKDACHGSINGKKTNFYWNPI